MENVKALAEVPFVIGDSLTLCDASHVFRTTSRLSPIGVVGVYSRAFMSGNAFRGVRYGEHGHLCLDTALHSVFVPRNALPRKKNPKLVCNLDVVFLG